MEKILVFDLFWFFLIRKKSKISYITLFMTEGYSVRTE